MTSKDLSIFNSLRPFSVGFDDMFDQFESMLGNGGLGVQTNYPPYNIRKAGKDKYAIEVALAGFNRSDVEIEYEDNTLTVRTKKVQKSENKDGDEIIHRGISQLRPVVDHYHPEIFHIHPVVFLYHQKINQKRTIAVSYTHLTLPTIDRV